jgi:alanyl-tRNA synthetase
VPGRENDDPSRSSGRFLEFWNLVFMAYEQHADGTLTPLPKQNIDTGLGLERGAAILQDVRTVYETDGYRQIMDWIASESGVAYGDSPAATKAHRVLADHGRAILWTTVIIRADKDVDYGKVQRMIKTCMSFGFVKYSLRASPSPESL